MGFKFGIVGLPNVGKSTLFNALTKTSFAETANYPFCTIDANIGSIKVPDIRLKILSDIVKSNKIIPTSLEFVDIAGLVTGANKGIGLGNKFLGYIKTVDVIIHVVRCFKDTNIVHVERNIDPMRDIKIIDTELILSDILVLEKEIVKLNKLKNKSNKIITIKIILYEKLLSFLYKGNSARFLFINEYEEPYFKELSLLSAKPILYVCNVSEDDVISGNNYTKLINNLAVKQGFKIVLVSAVIEAEIALIKLLEEQKEYLITLGMLETGLEQIIREGYLLLNLITFFTVGVKEVRAWTLNNRSKVIQAAGLIHTDFVRGFISADTISYNNFIIYNGEFGAKNNGRFIQNGQDYIVNDADIFHFHFNV